jgi:DNA-binding CsgD family transcriptional regulator/tetratricopeptide (TPR) repeat protein
LASTPVSDEQPCHGVRRDVDRRVRRRTVGDRGLLQIAVQSDSARSPAQPNVDGERLTAGGCAVVEKRQHRQQTFGDRDRLPGVDRPRHAQRARDIEAMDEELTKQHARRFAKRAFGFGNAIGVQRFCGVGDLEPARRRREQLCAAGRAVGVAAGVNLPAIDLGCVLSELVAAPDVGDRTIHHRHPTVDGRRHMRSGLANGPIRSFHLPVGIRPGDECRESLRGRVEVRPEFWPRHRHRHASIVAQRPTGTRKQAFRATGSTSPASCTRDCRWSDNYPSRVQPAPFVVGRDEELALLDNALADGALGGAVLAGPPGVGKTRLATAFLERAAEQGFATAWVAATRAVGSVPFGAFAHLLPGSRDIPAGGRLDVLRWAGEELRRRADGGRLVLGIDDAHLLDDGSAALAHQLAMTSTAFIVATLRTGAEEPPDPVVALWKDGLAERIEVLPLSRSQVGELLTHVLGGQVDEATRHRLWDVSGGNALFLRELVLSGLERGVLVERGAVWAWHGPLTAGGRLAELIEGRLAATGDNEREMLEVLAVGEPLSADTLARLADAEAMEAAERRGLIVIETTDKRRDVRLSHPLYGETLRAAMGSVRARAICSRLAEDLQATGVRRRGDALRLATWQLDGGSDAAPLTLVAASRQAIVLCDQVLAERLARAAVEIDGSYAALVELGHTLYWQGRHEDAQSLLAACDVDECPPPERVRAAICRASALFWGLGRSEQAGEVLARAEAVIDDVEWRLMATAHRAMIEFFSGRVPDALTLAVRVLDAPEAGERARTHALATAVPAWALSGRPEHAIVAAEAGLGAALRLVEEMPTAAGGILSGQCIALLLAGRTHELESLAGAVHGASISRAADDRRGMTSFLLGRALLARGRVRGARRQLREAAALLRETDAGRILSWCLGTLAQAAAMAGDVPAAEEALREVAEQGRGAMRVWAVELALGATWAAAARGEHSSARTQALAAADLAASAGQQSTELLALHDAARLGEAAAVEARLSGLAGRVEGRLAPVVAAHACALAAGDGTALDGASASFEELGADLLAAEAAAEAAEAHREAGLMSRHLASMTRARELADACESPRTPALAPLQQSGSLNQLTRREREVAELAAGGRSKREIAEHLVVSIRTVGSHLNHAYAKLGSSSRADLAMLFQLERSEPGIEVAEPEK